MTTTNSPCFHFNVIPYYSSSASTSSATEMESKQYGRCRDCGAQVIKNKGAWLILKSQWRDY